MLEELIIAGSGGQGIMLAGNVVAKAGFLSGTFAAWLPSYGPEARGGTAKCSVIISDEEIITPIIEEPDALIAMNGPSLVKYAPMVKSGGLIIANSSLCAEFSAGRQDVRIIEIDADGIAEKEIGNKKTANIVALGTYLGIRKLLSWDKVLEALVDVLEEEGKTKLFEVNKKALAAGARIAPARPGS
jgi:2-oxoglutarate ferredoxin oxidoreductase subunit gamma